MITHRDHFHGSDLEKIEAIYGIKKEEITSFSANVNPLGISPRLRESLIDHIDAITAYPDREYTSLRRCLAAYAGTVPERIIVGNGSTELISLFIQVEHPKKAMILGPTYSEYEREVALGGGTTVYYPLKEELEYQLDIEHFTSKLQDDIDLLILCNPNNPTSTSIDTEGMRRILDVCMEHGIYVMVDETYVEFCDQVKKDFFHPADRLLQQHHHSAGHQQILRRSGTSPGLRRHRQHGSASQHQSVQESMDDQLPGRHRRRADVLRQRLYRGDQKPDHLRTAADVRSLPGIRPVPSLPAHRQFHAVQNSR